MEDAQRFPPKTEKYLFFPYLVFSGKWVEKPVAAVII